MVYKYHGLTLLRFNGKPIHFAKIFFFLSSISRILDLIKLTEIQVYSERLAKQMSSWHGLNAVLMNI